MGPKKIRRNNDFARKNHRRHILVDNGTHGIVHMIIKKKKNIGNYQAVANLENGNKNGMVPPA